MVSYQFVQNIQTVTYWSFSAEPLKKRKKLDPAVVRAREERKKKKIEKQIRRLERNAKSYKPIEECEIPMNIAEEKE